MHAPVPTPGLTLSTYAPQVQPGNLERVMSSLVEMDIGAALVLPTPLPLPLPRQQ
jgi:hypothetical protein